MGINEDEVTQTNVWGTIEIPAGLVARVRDALFRTAGAFEISFDVQECHRLESRNLIEPCDLANED